MVSGATSTAILSTTLYVQVSITEIKPRESR
jgi:hypothetical protein